MISIVRAFSCFFTAIILFSSCKNEKGELVWFGGRYAKDDPILGCWREIPRSFPANASVEVCFRDNNAFLFKVTARSDSKDTLSVKMFRVLEFSPARYAKGKDTIIVSWKSEDIKRISAELYPSDTFFNSLSGDMDEVYSYAIDGDILTLNRDRYVRKE